MYKLNWLSDNIQTIRLSRFHIVIALNSVLSSEFGKKSKFEPCIKIEGPLCYTGFSYMYMKKIT